MFIGLIFAVSFGEAPTVDQVEEFKRICSHFFEQHPGAIIGGLLVILGCSKLKVVI